MRKKVMREESKQREEVQREALREESKPRQESMREGREKMWQRDETKRRR